MNAQAWYSSHGAAANTATKNASLIGAKNAPAGFSANICCPPGSRETSSGARHAYSWLADGSSARRAATWTTTPGSRRARRWTRRWTTTETWRGGVRLYETNSREDVQSTKKI